METSVKAPAKVNLVLRVTGKREDGYHEIKSVFQKVDLFDTLTFADAPDDKIELLCDNPQVPVNESNLIVMAAKLLQKVAGVKKGVKIVLTKTIPVSAGLGGGSSDAAVTLKELNRRWETGLPEVKLQELAFKLGADVPFFLGSALAWVEGAGEVVTPLKVKKSFSALIVNPGFGISAGEAYAGSRFDFAGFDRNRELEADIESGDPHRVCRHLKNDLEPYALSHYPELKSLKYKIEKTNPQPLGLVVSGSGPTIFAIYPDMETARLAGKKLEGVAPFIETVNTLTD
ncbi:4-diphosphocytidyl-2-C-methyl-D-erythritol kinase [hydrothermal vent metagenome]|uniref:4-(cytidine 5'-diphospho)-2-C-methyl-D-erythritol kinase n=1 Tax=hydrothermal vent metagenome TaxID=652676 RepID=A0A3B1BZ99_9ZZZZ